MLLTSPKRGADKKISCKISDFDRLINYINWLCDKCPMAPGQRLTRHSSISEDDPKHPVPLEQILDLRRVPLPQVTEQRCQDCQTDHRGVTEVNMLQFIGVAWSVMSAIKKLKQRLFKLVQKSPCPLICMFAKTPTKTKMINIKQNNVQAFVNSHIRPIILLHK